MNDMDYTPTPVNLSAKEFSRGCKEYLHIRAHSSTLVMFNLAKCIRIVNTWYYKKKNIYQVGLECTPLLKPITFSNRCDIWSSNFLILTSLYKSLASFIVSGSEEDTSSVEALVVGQDGILVRWRKWANTWSIRGVITCKLAHVYLKKGEKP